MNPAHLHLALNHAPLFAVVFASVGLAWALVRSNEQVGRAALGLLVLAGVLALPVYFSGEQAEDVVENTVGVSENALDAHEDAALGAAIALGSVGALALLVLIGFRKRALPRSATALALALALVASGWTGYVANLGGKINHPELRTDPASSALGTHEVDDD